MNNAQRTQARALASALINEGHAPAALVHVQYYPHDYELAETAILGISNPLPPGTCLNGPTSVYYRLDELAEDEPNLDQLREEAEIAATETDAHMTEDEREAFIAGYILANM